MTPLRLGILCRRFWPLGGGNEHALADFACDLLSQQVLPQIITTKPSTANWPSELTFRGVPVVRLSRSQTPGIGAMRHWFSLYRWIRSHRQQLDAILVSELRAETYMAIAALQNTSIPVLIRIERAGPGGDLDQLMANPLGSRILQQAKLANAFIVSSEAAMAELVAAGITPESIHKIAPSARQPQPITRIERQDAREAFAAINYDLGLPDNCRLLVAHGRLRTSEGFHELVAAWGKVLLQHPSTRLWIVGDGPERGRIFNQLKDLGLSYLVTLPGAVDDFSGLLAAADGWIIPTHGESAPGLLPAVRSRNLPLVLSDTPAHREHPLPENLTWWSQPRDARSLAEAICQMLEQAPSPASIPASASSETATIDSANAYRELLEKVCR